MQVDAVYSNIIVIQCNVQHYSGDGESIWLHYDVMRTNSRNYRQTSSISHALVGNKTVDHSDIVGASLIGAAPTTSSFLT